MEEKSLKIDVALVHYPVVNKTGDIIGSAVTNLDLHDIARAGCTYGIGAYWVVIPDAMQQEVAARIIAHWTEGYGGTVNPDRRDALALIRICSSLDEVIAGVSAEEGQPPFILATCAREGHRTITFEAARRMSEDGRRLLLLFGTAWGLAPEVLDRADGILPPLKGKGNYNHLSVRSAASIVLDRLLASEGER